MVLHNVGSYRPSFHNKVVRDLAALLLPLPPCASPAKASTTMPTTTTTKSSDPNHADEPAAADEPPPAKRRKTVDFSEQVEMRRVDEDDGSILSVETRDLHSHDDDDDDDDGNDNDGGPAASPVRLGRLHLDRAARDIDKQLFFLPRMERADIKPVLAYPAARSWDYGRLQDLLEHYREGDSAENMTRAAWILKRRTSSVLFALSRILKRIEDLEDARQLERAERYGKSSQDEEWDMYPEEEGDVYQGDGEAEQGGKEEEAEEEAEEDEEGDEERGQEGSQEDEQGEEEKDQWGGDEEGEGENDEKDDEEWESEDIPATAARSRRKKQLLRYDLRARR
ncbi:hypothetical protein C8A01DRAFT_42820 [Parachaetomium inaequale]|uniref:Uncharacterized protein n=1 Tax=Parachaetomium inaequale TaxID=2588326 RepID=A0AAN6SVA0_9PEZI|nr:hypothetical protein C8A01DRAFT_42820 [Parachaetomium inaequale]